jgi:ubiquitin-protein ligase
MTDVVSIDKLFPISTSETITKPPTTMCIKRLQSDLSLVKREPIENIDIYVHEDNLLIWYFLVYNLDDPYKYGYYIGRVIVDPDYPMKPPVSYKFFTPSGRFSIGEKICVTNSSYHSDSWSPLWNLKTVILGLVSIFLDGKETGIAHLHEPDEFKRMLAIQSSSYNRTNYLPLVKKFNKFINEDGSTKIPIPIDPIVSAVLDSCKEQELVNDDDDV